jgi:hypothetical protein
LLQREKGGSGGSFTTAARIGGVGDEDPVAPGRFREMEVPGLVPRVEEQQQRGALFVAVDEHGEGTRFVGFPVDRFLWLSVGTQPADVRNPVAREGLSIEEGLAPEDGELAPQGEESFHEVAQDDGLGRVVPRDPADLVVLAIAVVVALLGAHPFVA